MNSVPGVMQLLSKWAWSGFFGGSSAPFDSSSARILSMSSLFSLWMKREKLYYDGEKNFHCYSNLR